MGAIDLGAEPGAEQIARDRVDPKAYQAWVAELIAEFPTAHPSSLGDLLGFLDGGAPREQKSPVAGYPASNAFAYSVRFIA